MEMTLCLSFLLATSCNSNELQQQRVATATSRFITRALALVCVLFLLPSYVGAASLGEEDPCCEDFQSYELWYYPKNDSCYFMELAFAGRPDCDKNIIAFGLEPLNLDTCMKQNVEVTFQGLSQTVDLSTDPFLAPIPLLPPHPASQMYLERIDFCLTDSTCPMKNLEMKITVYFDDGSRCELERTIRYSGPPTSIEESEHKKFRYAYDKSFLTITAEISEGELEYEIIGLKGNKQFSGSLSSGGNNISIGSLPSGAYVVLIKSKGILWDSYKFVIQK